MIGPLCCVAAFLSQTVIANIVETAQLADLVEASQYANLLGKFPKKEQSHVDISEGPLPNSLIVECDASRREYYTLIDMPGFTMGPGKYLWQIDIITDRPARFAPYSVGLSSEKYINSKSGPRGLFFDGLNLHDGHKLNEPYGFPQLMGAGSYVAIQALTGESRTCRACAIENILIYIEMSTYTAKVWFVQNGVSLGLGYDVSYPPNPINLALVLGAVPMNVYIQKLASTESVDLVRSYVPDKGSIDGEWKSTVAPFNGVEAEIETTRRRFAKGFTLLLSIRVTNGINVELKCSEWNELDDAVASRCEASYLSTTLMLGPDADMKAESEIEKLFASGSQIDILHPVDNMRTLKIRNRDDKNAKTLEMARIAEDGFKTVTESPFQRKST